MDTHPRYLPLTVDTAAITLAVLALFLVLKLGLLPALLAGLLLYHLTCGLAPLLPSLASGAAKILVVTLIATLLILALLTAGFAAAAFVRAENGGLTALLSKMAEIIEHSRQILPHWVVEYLPQDVEDIRVKFVELLREHAGELNTLGRETIHMLVHVLIGMVVGAMLALHLPGTTQAPFAAALRGRAAYFSQAFRNIVFAQIKIAAINACFTGLYLGVILPLFGIKLPFVFTLILLTFVTGLIPVLGNILSNVVIVVVSLGYSLPVAMASLVFLVVIHKLEYFLNARIIGAQIQAKSWELLLAILTLEAAFGLPGVVAAPIYYAWAKAELRERALV